MAIFFWRKGKGKIATRNSAERTFRFFSSLDDAMHPLWKGWGVLLRVMAVMWFEPFFFLSLFVCFHCWHERSFWSMYD
jgi:hypothetical protein